MYPDFIRTANDGAVNIALLTFNYAYKTEQKHKPIFQNALEMLNSGKEAGLPDKYWVCPTCGNTYDTQPPKRCSLSMTPSERFIAIQ
jgi:rubrerythrin